MKTILKYIMKNRAVLLMIVMSLFTIINVKAQYEPMFTQYMFNETFINPAYVGSHENVSITLLSRNQWVGIEGAPKTQTFSIHSPINGHRFGIGLAVRNENIGVSHQLGVYTNFAYRILFDNSALSFGLQGGFVNDESRYTEVLTTTPGDNQFSSDTRKVFLPNAGFGIYYFREKFYAGFSIPRLIENNVTPSLTNGSVQNSWNIENWHYYFATGYVFDLNEDHKFKPSILVKAVQNAPVQLDVDANFLLKNFLWLGASYRSGDAIAAIIGFQVNKQLRFGYSYDYTLSKLQKYNSGSHEFTLGYEILIDRSRINSTRYF